MLVEGSINMDITKSMKREKKDKKESEIYIETREKEREREKSKMRGREMTYSNLFRVKQEKAIFQSEMAGVWDDFNDYDACYLCSVTYALIIPTEHTQREKEKRRKEVRDYKMIPS